MASFEGAPWTRLACVGSALGSLLFSPHLKRELDFNLGRVLAQGEVWRLGTRYLAFDSVGEAVVGLLSLYRFRRLERMLGPRKFAVFVAVTCGVATAVETAAFVVFSRSEATLKPASGPYALVFGLYALYYHLVPSVEPKLVGVLGLDVSDKTLMRETLLARVRTFEVPRYVLAAQLLLSHGLESFVAGAAGAIGGSVYLSETLGLHHYALPRRLFFFNARRPPPPPPPTTNHLARDLFEETMAPPLATARTPSPPPPPSEVPPSQDHIDALVAMGFDPDLSVAALTSCNNDIEVAANRLLSG